MGSKPKPCSHVASVAGRRVRDNPKLAKPGAGFKHDYRAASPKKLHKIITIEKTSTMRKSRALDLAQWVLHCEESRTHRAMGAAGVITPRPAKSHGNTRAAGNRASAKRFRQTETDSAR